MRLTCWECGKSVSTEVPEDTIVRATLVCPECFQDLCDHIRDETKEELQGSLKPDQSEMTHRH